MTIVACTDPAPVTGIVQFSAAEFLALYPQFQPQSQFLATAFSLATTQLANTCSSRIQDAALRQTLLYLLTAHITTLMWGQGATPASGLVGRIDTGVEGSVQVEAEYDVRGGPSEAYYIQTQFGAAFWMATMNFRTMKYIPGPDAYRASGQCQGVGATGTGWFTWPWNGPNGY